MNKLLVICGPTATGKTELGVYLSHKFNGEIISGDSRQVYRGMDIITGKDLPDNSKLQIANDKLHINDDKFTVGFRLKDEIPVWLVDIVEPDYLFSAGEYAQLAHKVLNNIFSRGKLAIVVGGTGFYIRSIISPYETYLIPPDNKLRSELAKDNLENLQKKLQEADLLRWEGMNDSDRGNPRRLIRAIEVAGAKKTYTHKFSDPQIVSAQNLLMIGLKTDFHILRERIYKRIIKRTEQGAIEEVKKLSGKKYSWFSPALSATGALELKKFIDGSQTLDEAINSWQYREIAYAKSQLTWFKKEKRIMWFDFLEKGYLTKIEGTVEKWYTESW